jgi:hypothetical protein
VKTLPIQTPSAHLPHLRNPETLKKFQNHGESLFISQPLILLDQRVPLTPG